MNKVIVIGVIVALLIISILGFYFLIMHHNSSTTGSSQKSLTTDQEFYISESLKTVLGNGFSVEESNGSSSSAQLLFGTIGDPSFFVNYSYIYYIENGSGYIKIYPAGPSSYWGALPYDLGVMRIVPAKPFSAAALMMNSQDVYYTGGNYTVMLVGTFSNGSSEPAGLYNTPDYPADGFSVGMFITPVHNWINMSTKYTYERDNVGMKGWPATQTGEIFYPYSKTPYIIVQ
ncbi:hypothetical protein IC006_0508 [Sulfuracidifex tepidarius]|nr:hypothetical protein [Sulfuracidifex tepidarius]BBG23224.1 hypothetical protein IC006_0508 [Sulfuracidifex tepidarius]